MEPAEKVESGRKRPCKFSDADTAVGTAASISGKQLRFSGQGTESKASFWFSYDCDMLKYYAGEINPGMRIAEKDYKCWLHKKPVRDCI
jgi:hypothetical protein